VSPDSLFALSPRLSCARRFHCSIPLISVIPSTQIDYQLEIPPTFNVVARQINGMKLRKRVDTGTCVWYTKQENKCLGCLFMDELIRFFYRMKWPDGFRCPRCLHPRAYTIRGRSLPLYQCMQCRHQTSLKAGTVLEKSRTPLEKWAEAIRAMSRLHSINAVQLMTKIRVTYKTAWSMLRKLRQSLHAMDSGQPLTGRV